MTDWKLTEDSPDAEMRKRWLEEEEEQNAFEELAEVAYPASIEHLDHLVPERFEIAYQRMSEEVDPYYIEPVERYDPA